MTFGVRTASSCFIWSDLSPRILFSNSAGIWRRCFSLKQKVKQCDLIWNKLVSSRLNKTFKILYYTHPLDLYANWGRVRNAGLDLTLFHRVHHLFGKPTFRMVFNRSNPICFRLTRNLGAVTQFYNFPKCVSQFWTKFIHNHRLWAKSSVAQRVWPEDMDNLAPSIEHSNKNSDTFLRISVVLFLVRLFQKQHG